MTRSNTQILRASTLALLTCTVIHLGSSAHAQVAVPSTVNFDAGTSLYTYSYSVMNNGPTFDLAILNVPVAPDSNLMSLLAPTGFGISFDPGVGIVSFFEDSDPATTQIFSPGSTNGLFKFTSTFAPGTVTFDSLDAGGNTFTGSTQAPTTAVPEPGTIFLVGLGVVAASFRRRSVSISK